MSLWLDKLRGATGSPDTATYKALRTAAKSWFPKVMRHPASKHFDIVKAAKKLTLPVEGRAIVFAEFGLPQEYANIAPSGSGGME